MGEEDGGHDNAIPALPSLQEGDGCINDVEEVVVDSFGAKEPNHQVSVKVIRKQSWPLKGILKVKC